MSDLTKMLVGEARKLTPLERIELVEQILHSLDGIDPRLEQAWSMEAKDRLDALRRGELTSKDLDVVLAKFDVR